MTVLAGIHRNRLCWKATEECHVLIAGELVHGDMCSVA